MNASERSSKNYANRGASTAAMSPDVPNGPPRPGLVLRPPAARLGAGRAPRHGGAAAHGELREPHTAALAPDREVAEVVAAESAGDRNVAGEAPANGVCGA